jgi:hypothetical protein
MFELIFTIPVTVWFVTEAWSRKQSGLFWGLIAILSYFVPRYALQYILIATFGLNITPSSSPAESTLATIATTGSLVVGIICCMRARRALLAKAPTRVLPPNEEEFITKVKLSNGLDQETRITAASPSAAREKIESIYGKNTILQEPQSVAA